MMSILHPLLIIAIASGSGASDVSPNGNAGDVINLSTRELQKDIDLHHTGPDGRCNNLIRTKSIDEAYLGQGIFFAIQSNVDDDEGLMITSFGFHLDLPTLKFSKEVNYKVFALNKMGYYASPERQSDISGAINETKAEAQGDGTYDYRIDKDVEANWEQIAEGKLVNANLTLASTTLALDEDFYQIPLGTFSSYVPPNGGIRSFFIATDARAFIYSDVADNDKVNDQMSILGTPDVNDYTPHLLVGEGIVTYPTLPDAGYLYQTRAFVGKIFYEKECPSAAPSISTSPSLAPTVAFSEIPSLSPTLTSSPSYLPSAVPSQLPSMIPTQQPTDYVEKIKSGVKVSFGGVDCVPGEPIEGAEFIEASVRKIAKEAASKESDYIDNIKAEVKGMFCKAEGPFERHHRRLPTGSSALDFSVVVTGEYRPPSRPGQRPPPLDIDIGRATEDSINRDPVAFVKDIQERAALTDTVFTGVEPEDIEVRAQVFEVPADVSILATEEITPSPTKSPTPMPTPLIMAKEETDEEEKGNDSILIICIVITGGMIVLLGAFLLFRHGERKAAKTRRNKLERQELQKEQVREGRRQQAQWDAANKNRMAGKDRDDNMKDIGRGGGGPPPQYGNPGMAAYGQPPPQPNYYTGGPPPQQPPYGQSFAGPTSYDQQPHYPPPPPPYGQSYGGPNPQGFPYPAPPGVPPPMAGAGYDQRGPANYDQQPRGVRWKQ